MSSFSVDTFDALTFDAGAFESVTETAVGGRRDVDDTLWQIVAGSDASGWRDITDECGDLVYSNVRPGGAASASFTLPADVWGLGYNEVSADSRLKVSYAGRTVWDGYVLPRGVNYQGE
jgi:hypothetical protein